MHQIHLMAINWQVTEIVFVGEYDPWFDIVLSFACMLINLTFVIAFVTFTVVTARGIGTMLWTNTWSFDTFVNVRTCFSVRKESKNTKRKKRVWLANLPTSAMTGIFVSLLVALITVTVVAGQCINTFVATLMNLHFGTFVHITMSRLVRLVGAVDLLVAYQLIVDTWNWKRKFTIYQSHWKNHKKKLENHLISLYKVSRKDLILLTLSIGARKLSRSTGTILLLRTTHFIRMIAAIIFTVASILWANTFEVLACEFLWWASFILWVTEFSFIASVTAIVIVIA